MMMMVERCAAAQASAKHERRRAGMSAANVGASKDYFRGHKIPPEGYRQVFTKINEHHIFYMMTLY